MKTLLLLFLGCCMATVTYADQLSDQLKALKSAQDQNDEANWDAARAQAERERQEEEKKQAQIRAAERAREERVKEAAAQEKAKNDERLKDKARIQAQEDEEHALEMEQKRAKVEETKAISAAKAARAKDYVDADLSKQKAETDVIQSNADANRNISEGAKELQTGIGKGAEAAGKSWFK
jgi:hypothetical protein